MRFITDGYERRKRNRILQLSVLIGVMSISPVLTLNSGKFFCDLFVEGLILFAIGFFISLIVASTIAHYRSLVPPGEPDL